MRRRAGQFRGWLAQPLILKRGHFLGTGLVVGLLLAGALLGAHLALVGVKHERNQRIAEAEGALRRERLTKADVRAISRRQAKLERPSRADLLRLIRRAQRVCLGSPRCRRLAAQGQRELAQGPAAPTSTPGSGVAPGQTGPQTRPGGRPKPRPRPGRGGGGQGGSGPPASPQPPPRPPPPVDIHTPPSLPLPVPELCTPVIGLNCGR